MSLIGNWSYPTTVRFGAGRVEELGDACADVGIDKPLLVTDRALSRLPITRRVLGILEAYGFGNSLFADVEENPNDTNLQKGVQKFKEDGYDGIITLGGGSARAASGRMEHHASA